MNYDTLERHKFVIIINEFYWLLVFLWQMTPRWVWTKIRIIITEMIQQKEFSLSAKSRGYHLVTHKIMANLPLPLPKAGLLNLFVKHTSCALSINENADPDVRSDMEKIMNHIVRENEPYYDHVLEGSDDMPAHAKSSLFGVSITIPITDSHLNLGTWQGIYLCEFRDYGGPRRIVATIYN